MKAMTLRVLAVILGLAVLFGFAAIYGYQIWRCWSPEGPDVPTGAAVYVATALSGLIGGVIAMEFNEQLPPAKVPGAYENSVSATGPEAAAKAARNTVWPRTDDVLDAVIAIYAIVYLLVGLAAIATWLRLDTATPDLIKNLALVVFGLIIAVARTLFHVPTKDEAAFREAMRRYH